MQTQGTMGMQNHGNVQNQTSMPMQTQGPMSGGNMPQLQNMQQPPQDNMQNMGNTGMGMHQGMSNQSMGMGGNMPMQQNMSGGMNRAGPYMNKMGQEDPSRFSSEPNYHGNPPSVGNNSNQNNTYGGYNAQRQGMLPQPNMGMSGQQGMQQQGVPPVAQPKMYPGMEAQQQRMGGQYMSPMSQQQQQGYISGDPSKQGMYPSRMGHNQSTMPQGYPHHASQNNNYNRSQQQPGMSPGGGGYMGPQGNNPYQQHQQSSSMGSYNPQMPGMPPQRPGSNPSQQPDPINNSNIPSQPASGNMPINSAQTFSVNQPLGSQLPPHQQPLLPQDPTKPMTAQQGLMHSIINDRSSAFRTHPLFPLLRDLIIADMNFHTPSFPFQLIANLPGGKQMT